MCSIICFVTRVVICFQHLKANILAYVPQTTVLSRVEIDRDELLVNQVSHHDYERLIVVFAKPVLTGVCSAFVPNRGPLPFHPSREIAETLRPPRAETSHHSGDVGADGRHPESIGRLVRVQNCASPLNVRETTIVAISATTTARRAMSGAPSKRPSCWTGARPTWSWRSATAERTTDCCSRTAVGTSSR